MRGKYLSKNLIFPVLIIALLSFVLSGCLVENSDPIPVKERTTDNLRIVSPGERLVYRLTGQRTIDTTTTPISGTMTVEWSDDIIPDPHNSSANIDVIRELTVVDFDNGLTTTTIKYLTQDTDGSVFVHAYRQKNNLVYTGLYVTNPAQTDVSYTPIEMVASPLTASNPPPFSYRLFQSCGNTASCPLASSLRQIVEGIEFRDDVPVTIDAGKNYQSFYYTYTGSFLEDNSTPFVEAFDFRTSCGEVPTGSITGEYFYYPEVGLIKFLSSCEAFSPSNGSSYGHRITGVLLSASFPLP